MGTLLLEQCLSGHKGRVWNVAWHPSKNCLATCGEDRTIRIWKSESKKWINKTILTDAQQRTIREVAWSPSGNCLASASFDGTIAIWEKKNGSFECNTTLEGHENEVKSVAWSPSGKFFATCSRDKSVWIWEITEDNDYECAAVLNAHSQDVKKVVWHPTQEILASASYDNTIKIYKEDPSDNDWFCVATLKSHESTVWSISFNKTGDKLASCSDDQTVKIWKEYLPGNPEGIATEDNLPTWKCICTISGYHTRTIYDVAWCHETDLIATACGDDIIRIFKETSDSNSVEPTFELLYSEHGAHTQDVNAVKWNPRESKQLASCSDDGNVKIWIFTEKQ